jgi:hypothetical protein
MSIAGNVNKLQYTQDNRCLLTAGANGIAVLKGRVQVSPVEASAGKAGGSRVKTGFGGDPGERES